MAIKHLVTAALLLIAGTSFSQITTSGGQVYLSQDAINSYLNPGIIVQPTLHLSQVVCRLQITSGASTDVVAEYTIVLAKSVVDAKTGTGSADSDKFLNAVVQAVKDVLSGIAKNSGITFTI